MGTARAVRPRRRRPRDAGTQQRSIYRRVLLEPGDRWPSRSGYPGCARCSALTCPCRRRTRGREDSTWPSCRATTLVYVRRRTSSRWDGALLASPYRVAPLADRHDASSSKTTTTASSASPTPVAPLQSLDRSGRVIYWLVPKTMLPMLRLASWAPASTACGVDQREELADSSDRRRCGCVATSRRWLVARMFARPGASTRRAQPDGADAQTDFAAWLSPSPLADCTSAPHAFSADLDVPQLLCQARKVGVAVHSWRAMLRQPQQGSCSVRRNRHSADSAGWSACAR